MEFNNELYLVTCRHNITRFEEKVSRSDETMTATKGVEFEQLLVLPFPVEIGTVGAKEELIDYSLWSANLEDSTIYSDREYDVAALEARNFNVLEHNVDKFDTIAGDGVGEHATIDGFSAEGPNPSDIEHVSFRGEILESVESIDFGDHSAVFHPRDSVPPNGVSGGPVYAGDSLYGTFTMVFEETYAVFYTTALLQDLLP